MHEFICFNQKITRAAESSISAVSSAALYGRGIFTTVAIHDKKPFLWEKHWRRLSENAARLRIDLSALSEKKVKNALFELIEKNSFTTGRARITFFDESASGIWNFETLRQTSFLIMTADRREIKNHLRVCVAPYTLNSASPLSGMKSCNYLENILMLDKARSDGFDEAIWLNERGEIASACLANIFWTKNDKVFTPSLSTGCLPGTTREFLIENFDAEEVAEKLEVLKSADAIFLVSSGIGIAPITEFDERKYKQADAEKRGFYGSARMLLKTL